VGEHGRVVQAKPVHLAAPRGEHRLCGGVDGAVAGAAVVMVDRYRHAGFGHSTLDGRQGLVGELAGDQPVDTLALARRERGQVDDLLDVGAVGQGLGGDGAGVCHTTIGPSILRSISL
jgi:hypothetical protein